MNEREQPESRRQLEQAIAHMEAQRATLGDAVVDAALGSMRRQLAELEEAKRRPAPAWEGERRLVTIMFADISGFTALTETIDPEAVRDLVNACFERLVPVVEKYGGTVDKFMGDNIMALFGAPVAHEDDAERALRAALEMVDKLRTAHPGFLYSTSGGGANVETGRGMPPASQVETVDFVLLHGNGTRPPQLEAAIKAVQAMPVYQRNPKPIVINGDSPAIPNLDAAWRNGASWGYYDQGWEGQADDPYVWYEPLPRKSDGPFEELNGFQTPPVNWTINTDFKRAFFNRVAEITGMSGTRELVRE